MVSGDFEALTAAVERLTLNDASVTVQRETSNALGAGFRCGCAPQTQSQFHKITWTSMREPLDL